MAIEVKLVIEDETQLALLQEALADMSCMDDFKPYRMDIDFAPEDDRIPNR